MGGSVLGMTSGRESGANACLSDETRGTVEMVVKGLWRNMGV